MNEGEGHPPFEPDETAGEDAATSRNWFVDPEPRQARSSGASPESAGVRPTSASANPAPAGRGRDEARSQARSTDDAGTSDKSDARAGARERVPAASVPPLWSRSHRSSNEFLAGRPAEPGSGDGEPSGAPGPTQMPGSTPVASSFSIAVDEAPGMAKETATEPAQTAMLQAPLIDDPEPPEPRGDPGEGSGAGALIDEARHGLATAAALNEPAIPASGAAQAPGPEAITDSVPDGRVGDGATEAASPDELFRCGAEAAGAPGTDGPLADRPKPVAPLGMPSEEEVAEPQTGGAGTEPHPGPASPDGSGAGQQDAAGDRLVLPIAPSGAADGRRAILRLPPTVLKSAGLRPGDTVVVEGARTTHARVLPGVGEAAACGRVFAENLGVDWGDTVTIRRAQLDVADKVHLQSVGAKVLPATLFPALRDLTVTLGDIVEIEDDQGPVLRARVEAVEPGPAARIGDETTIEVGGGESAPHGYENIAGLAAEIAAVHELVESPLRRPDLFRRLGLDPPRGILFTGPPGSGKTLLARAVARRTEAAFFHVAGPEIMSKHYGESEAALRAVFEAATRSAPSVVFIDEIDAIAPRRGALSGEKQVERRVVAQLLTLLDGLEDRGRIVVMAATNLPDDLDPALRRPGRFDREIAFSTPGPADRAAILALHLGSAPLAADADLPGVAARAHGYVGADLAALAREAGLAALARSARSAGGLEKLDGTTLEITGADIEAGLRLTRPSALRAAAVPDRPLRWTDIGGLAAAKVLLEETVLWPMEHPAAMRRLGLGAPRGVLLVGPPGTGKTTLVRALATESGMNFMAARPATLLSQYLGEAERALADLFARARATSPTLLFLDELDGLAPKRGTADPTTDRLVAQLLTELDGLEGNQELLVIAATNRVDAIDPALTRPGRFDTRIDVGLPDDGERAEILGVLLRDRPVAGGVDAAALAAAMEGWSPARMSAGVDAAARRALARFVRGGEATAPLEIRPEDFALGDGRAVSERAM